MPEHVDIHGYVDDHALKKSFLGSSRETERDTIRALEVPTESIKSWMDQNRLKMNNEKTEFILIGSRQQLGKVTTTEINIPVSEEIIQRKDFLKLLGATLDNRLTFKKMISLKCQIAMGNLQELKRIRKYSTLDASKTIALGLIITHLDYANALYAGLPDTGLQKLQRVQNMTAKVVTGTSKYDSSTAALKTLHWLPIRLRIEFKILTLEVRAWTSSDLLVKPCQSKSHGWKTRPALWKEKVTSESTFYKVQDICRQILQCLRTKDVEQFAR